MDLVEDDDGGLRLGAEKQLGVVQAACIGGQIAIEIDGIGQHARQSGLSDASDACQPDDWALFPGGVDTAQPERAFNHEYIINKWAAICQL